jgi:serine/threonine protein kinase
VEPDAGGVTTIDDEAWRPPAEPDSAPASDPHLLPGYAGAVEVARGADSIVYRARQVALGRDVAVKVLQVDDAATAARFQRELELTVRLGRQHPHIVTVLDTGTTADGRPCIVMEYLERGSLQDVLRATGPLASTDVVRVGKVVADALAFAHGQGVLHRDVKPQNILVLPTSWVLADFGIARLADSGATASVEQFSYRRAAPQVLDGLPPTAADDGRTRAPRPCRARPWGGRHHAASPAASRSSPRRHGDHCGIASRRRTDDDESRPGGIPAGPSGTHGEACTSARAARAWRRCGRTDSWGAR